MLPGAICQETTCTQFLSQALVLEESKLRTGGMITPNWEYLRTCRSSILKDGELSQASRMGGVGIAGRVVAGVRAWR